MSASRKRNAGTVLLVSILFTVVLAATAGSMLKLASTESRVNASNQLYLDATHLAEALLEYGAEDLQQRWGQVRASKIHKKAILYNPLSPPTTNHLFTTFNLKASDSQLIGGKLSGGEFVYIDPDEASNASDPMRGHWVFVREVELYAKATVSDSILGDTSAYVSQTFSVRDTPLLSYLVFYSMDLEFSSRKPFRIVGPVHSNGTIYLQAKKRKGLSFYSRVHALNIYTESKHSSAWDNNAITAKSAISGDVNFLAKQGKTGLSSKDANWYKKSNKLWEGNVKSKVHGVVAFHPVSVDHYKENTTGMYDLRTNHPYALIEPQLKKSSNFYKGDAIAAQQFSRHAGLIFKVVPKPTFGYDVKAYTPEKTSQGKVVLDSDGVPELREIDLTELASKSGGKDLIKENVAPSGDPPRFKDRIWTTGIHMIDLDIEHLASLINNAVVNPRKVDDPFSKKFKVIPRNPQDVADWNGLVYVEFPTDESTQSQLRVSGDKILMAKFDASAYITRYGLPALRLINAKEIPNPAHAKTTDGVQPGFTLVTNGPLYIKGNFNADGNKTTGKDNEVVGVTDDGKSIKRTKEVPAMLVADSVTVLSENYDPSNPSGKAAFTEISAGIVTGIRPTRNSTEQSGGLNSAIRLMQEDWDGVELRIRGSIVVPYESEIFDGKYYNYNVLQENEPIRNFAHSPLFANGIFPPFGGGLDSPLVIRSFSRKKFRILSADEYNQAVSNI